MQHFLIPETGETVEIWGRPSRAHSTVRLSNDFARGHFPELSVQTHRLLRAAYSKIEHQADMFGMIRITARDLKEAFPFERRSRQIHERMEKNAKELMRIEIEIRQGKNFKLFHLVRFCEYREGQLFLKFEEVIKPYLLRLQANYSRTTLQAYQHFDSPATFQLNDALVSHLHARTGRGRMTLSPAEYRQLIGLRPDAYATFSDLRRRAIDPHLEVINRSGNMKVTMSLRRGARGLVHEMIFEIERKIALAEDPVVRAVVSRLQAFGMVPTTAEEMVLSYGPLRCAEKTLLMKNMDKEEAARISNPAGWLVKAIVGDWSPTGRHELDDLMRNFGTLLVETLDPQSTEVFFTRYVESIGSENHQWATKVKSCGQSDPMVASAFKYWLGNHCDESFWKETNDMQALLNPNHLASDAKSTDQDAHDSLSSQ